MKIKEAGDRTKVQKEANNEEAAEQERNNSDEKVDHQYPIENLCAECGEQFNEKGIVVDNVTNIHTERKVCSLCQETLKNFNRNMSQI